VTFTLEDSGVWIASADDFLSFLASEPAFRIVKSLEDRNLVIPVVGNFAGTFYWFKGEGKGEFRPKPEVIKVGTEPLKIDGLWGLSFGNGDAAGPTSTLYFLSGPSGQKHGLFGSITAG
jgi:hypothetical protein